MNMELNNEGQDTSQVDLTNPLYKELYFLIAKFLSGGPCQRASEALIQELEANEIIPTSVNWLGESLKQDYRTFSSKFDHISPDHLPKLLEQLVKTVNTKESCSKVTSRSLLSYSTYSLLNKSSDSPKKSSGFTWSKKYGQNLLLRPCRERKAINNPVQAIVDRPLSGCGMTDLIKPDFYKRMGVSCNTLGHLSAVYCVLFDNTGKYIFTGADDHLVKIWSAIDGRLLATLRGTSSEVSDLAINYENTLLAVASCDRLIRVWCLRTCAPVDVLNGHGGNVTSIFFCPIPRSRSTIRYLASTSTDGACAFWAYTDEPGERVQFQPKPTLYLEKMRPGHAQMICSSFSSGGVFMAAGSADNHVRVYHMLKSDGPERILEVAHHTDRVDSISWAHEGVKFVSGSKDGTALIWRFENGNWRYVRLYCVKSTGVQDPVSHSQEDTKNKSRVTMVGWNCDDSLVLTAVSDFMVKVWSAKTGELIRVLKEHTDEAYVIEAHPFNPRVVCTAGHDGKLIIWDIGTINKEDTGGKVFEYYNQLSEGQGHGSLFDCKWSPDGFSIAATDSHGHIMVFTVEANKGSKKKLPGELFFHTDYRPITRDAVSNEIVDEQTQVPPHLMPPPFLVDVDGNPYPPHFQRLVPGRENVSEQYLIPNVAMSAAGYQEVIEGIPARSNIDVMIQQLAIQQGLQEERERNLANRDRRGVGLRRSGEVEGVRQSRGDWQTGSYGFSKRHVVSELSDGVLARSEEVRLGYTEFEENWYREHLTKTSPSTSSGCVASSVSSLLESPGGRSRRIRRLALQAAERRQQQQMNNVNFYEVEGVARPNPRPQMEISVSQESPRRPLTTNQSRRRNDRPANPNRRPRPIRYDVDRIDNRGESDIENVDVEDDDSSSEAHVSMSSSDSSDDSDSDWGGTLGSSKTREQESRKKPSTEGRKRSQRLNSNSSGSPDREEEQKESDDDNEEEDEPKAGPSSESAAAVVKTEVSKQSRARKARGKVDYSGGLEEIPEQYRPCEWLAEVTAKRSPYFPQLGDDLVYYRQGHELYIKEVESKNMYEIPKKLKKSLPYVQKPDMEPEVSVRVVGIKYELEPPRLVALKLARTDWKSRELIGEHFYVKYHDVPDVVDFLIVRQMYEKSVRRRWNEGDKFRCLIQREWWLGTIESRQPFDDKFQDSNYLCYKVTWDNGDPERMSPWDMDLIPDDFETPEDHSGQEGIPASEEDLRIGLYEPTPLDWPPHGHQDAQCQKISNLLEQVMGLAISEAFLTPVDLNLYPDYSYIITYPIDLSTIKSRLDNRFYRRIDALKFDVKYIAMNAEKFNQLDSDIVKHSRVIRDVCLEIISNPDITELHPVYHSIMKNYTKKEAMDVKSGGRKGAGAGCSKSSGNAGRNEKGSRNSGRSQRGHVRKAHGRKQDSDDDSEEEASDMTWQDRCLELLNNIWHCKDAAAFREPVDIIDNPDYYHVIDTPMDLQTCREELLGGNYESPNDFHKDMQMIFSNSKQFNTDKHSAIYSMTLRLQNMYECQIKPILRLGQRTSKRNKKSSSRGSSPPKRSSSRFGNTSSTSTPRKNPKRSAAAKNPYVHNEHGESSDDNVGRRLRTRMTTKRGGSKYSRTENGNVNGRPGVNGHRNHPSRTNGYFSPRGSNDQRTRSQPTRPRPVKKFRISSESSHPSSPRRGMATRNSNTPSAGSISPPSKSAKRHRIPIKDEPDSDEFEDSDEVTMPTLNKVNDGDNDKDEDYSNNSDNDTDEEVNHASLRRSTRKQPTRRRHESEDGYCYETRFRGKHVQSYADNDASDEEDEGRYGKRRRIEPQGSPTRPGSLRGSPRQPVQPPILRRSGYAISESEGSHEEQEIDPNQPGPSSRFMRGSVAKPNTAAKSNGIRIKNELHEEEEEDDEVNADHDSEEESSEEGDSDEENNDDETESYSRKPRATTRRSNDVSKVSKRRTHVSSDEEDYSSSPARKRKAAIASSGRRSTRGNRPDYAEDDSDSEPRISVSSRGRIRRTKSFLGDQ